MNILKQRTIVENLTQAARELEGWGEIVKQGEELLDHLKVVNKNDLLHCVINCAFDEDTLVAAWKALFGDGWKSSFRDYDRVREMKSIINGGTMPCRPIENWIKCIDILRHCL